MLCHVSWTRLGRKFQIGIQSNYNYILTELRYPVMANFGVGARIWCKKKPCLIGLFGGTSKPHPLREYLSDLVTEIQIIAAGFTFKGTTLFIKIASVCPCTSIIKAIKSHTGYAGCDKCTIHGLYVDGRMTFPDTKSSVRTDEFQTSFGWGTSQRHLPTHRDWHRYGFYVSPWLYASCLPQSHEEAPRAVGRQQGPS